MFYEGGGIINGIQSYLLSIFAGAVICTIVTKLVGEKGTLGALTKLMSGIFLAVMLIRPLASIDLSGVTQWAIGYDEAAAEAVAEGQSRTRKAVAEIITQRTRTYILDKAQALNTALEVEVTLSDDEIPIPIKVRLSGKASPYAKGQLQQIITEELGIEKENQIWT